MLERYYDFDVYRKRDGTADVMLLGMRLPVNDIDEPERADGIRSEVVTSFDGVD